MAAFAFLAISLFSVMGAAQAAPYTEEQALQCILGEARGEPYEGQVAVAEVLRRRGGTVGFYGAAAIRRQGNRYYATEKGKLVLLSRSTVDRARKAWKESERSDWSKSATHFEGDAFKKPYWSSNMKLVAHIGHQQFFREV